MPTALVLSPQFYHPGDATTAERKAHTVGNAKHWASILKFDSRHGQAYFPACPDPMWIKTHSD